MRSPFSAGAPCTMCGLVCLLFVTGCPQAATTLEDFDDQSAGVAAPSQSALAAPGAPQNTPGAPRAAAPAGAQAPVAAAPGAAGPVRPSAPMLFMYGDTGDINLTDEGVFGLANPAGLNGDYLRNEVVPTNHIPAIDGFARWIAIPFALSVDRAGALVVLVGDGMLVFNKAETAEGNLIPDRRLDASRSVRWLNAKDMVMDRERDRLFVSNGEVIFVFDAFSSIPSGEVTPTRIIESIDFEGSAPSSLALGLNGDLYCATFRGSVAVFADPGSRSGRTLADRIIQLESPGLSLFSDRVFVESVFVDQQDRLYIASDDEDLYVVDKAATREGVVLADRKITIEQSTDRSVSLDSLVVDSAGVGFILDDNNATIHTVENIGARDGTVTPERSIRRMGSSALYLWE